MLAYLSACDNLNTTIDFSIDKSGGNDNIQYGKLGTGNKYITFDMDDKVIYSGIYLKYFMSRNALDDNLKDEEYKKYKHMQCFNVIHHKKSNKLIIVTPEEYLQMRSLSNINFDNDIVYGIDYNRLAIPGMKSYIEFLTDKKISNETDLPMLLDKITNFDLDETKKIF